MLIAVRGNEEQQQSFARKALPADVQVNKLSPNELLEETEADVYFDFLFDELHTGANLFVKGRPVFINSVISTAADFKYSNHIRFNGWPGFFENDILELVSADEKFKQQAENVLQKLGWKHKWVPDVPGMVVPRIISMIVNEAYFGLEDEISTKEEIDTAMKLGTNYPYGPFEWSRKIGLKRIFLLLKKLAETDDRYTPSTLLEKEASAE